MFNGNKFYFNNIQGKVKKWRGQVKVERKIKQNGTKRVIYKKSRYQNRTFFWNGLKDKNNTKNSVGEESNV